MTVKLDLSTEMEARLIVQAAAKGVSVEQYLHSLIETDLLAETEQPVDLIEANEEWVNLLETFCNNPALANVPPLSDEAISRESIYREREDSQL
ncbi:hypothetical protein IQ241_00955 [Romeria aff. gracilis LEGE 07310]|uniref:Uncharacterized protein n=1 Tax=Vasconcelosia minhoensis LEGE 07310 TaxID=915328 RepID=A0A8J7DB58_9CYAN|nr:hypothetical protein [Romeria gracilis]MBE9075878.1 hypothetical protein [Romeria aff. gracilis LEGE 07310]